MAKRTVLVIQTAGAAELFQSLMAMRAAQQLYPELEYTVIVRPENAEIIKRVPWVAGVITLPNSAELSSLKDNPAAIVAQMGRWTTKIIEHPWDYALNWTFGESGRYLLGLAPAKNKLGISCDSKGRPVYCDGWSQFMVSVVAKNLPQDIHLTDLFTTQLLTALQIQEGPPKNHDAQGVSTRGFFRLSVPQDGVLEDLNSRGRRWIAVQLATHAGWDSAHWAGVIREIFVRHPQHHCVLLGSGYDAALAVSVIQQLEPEHRARVMNVSGRADFDLWAAILSRCHWVIGVWGEPVTHLASLLGTQAVALKIGPSADPERFGPYGNGHVVVAPTGTELDPKGVYAAWSFAASEWSIQRAARLDRHFSMLGPEFTPEGIRAYRSRIRSVDEGGGVCYEPMIREKLSYGTWVSKVMGQVARQWFCGWTAPMGQEIKNSSVHPGLLASLRQLTQVGTVALEAAVKGQRLAADWKRTLEHLPSLRIMALSDRQRLVEFESQLLEVRAIFERLGRLDLSTRVMHGILEGLLDSRDEDLKAVALSTKLAYAQIEEGLVLVLNWANATLEIAKPKEVQLNNVVPFAAQR